MADIDTKDRKQSAGDEKSMAPKTQEHKPNKPWEIDVDVYLKSVSPLDFELRTCLPIDPANKNISFSNNGRPGFTISFHLYDNTNGGSGSGYVFPNPPAPPHKEAEWALWSKQGQGCPPKDHGEWDQFTSTNVKDHGLTLVVANKNDSVTEFGYTLRVTNDNGASFVDLDPGGNNQNGAS